MSTIPAKAIVAVNPQVLGSGGTGLTLNGMILTASARVPIGVAQPFASALDVSTYFGPSSKEAAVAAVYFAGFDNSNIKPGNVFFTQYPQTAVGAYLRGAPVTSLTLAQLGALTGSLTVLLDGYTHTASSISLSGCTSYSNAAAIIQTALFATEPTEATSSASTIAGTVLTVGGTLTGTFAVGQTLAGSGVTANSVITSLGTGTGGAGTYNLSQSSTIGSPQSITAVATAGTVAFDSTSGGFVVSSGITGVPSTAAFATGTLAPLVYLTQATGAVVSQGAAAAVPAAFMTALAAQVQNWASFMTTFDPDGGSGNTVKLAFSSWTTLQLNRWIYVCWDTDASPTVTVPATTSLGYLLAQGNYSGTLLIYEPTDINLSAFVCGMIASIDFTETNGRITLMGKGQTGIVPNVTNETVGDNLIANGYNFYGAYATATTLFNFFNPGSISGPFQWADGFANEIWLDSAFQNNLMTLVATAKSIPYDAFGRQLIEAACSDTIQAGLNFGAFAPGVELSGLQKAEVNAAAGAPVADIIIQQGYYFQVLPASAAVRQARKTPPINFWYADAGSVQQMVLDSIALL